MYYRLRERAVTHNGLEVARYWYAQYTRNAAGYGGWQTYTLRNGNHASFPTQEEAYAWLVKRLGGPLLAMAKSFGVWNEDHTAIIPAFEVVSVERFNQLSKEDQWKER